MSDFDDIETSRLRLRLIPKSALKALSKRDIDKAAKLLAIRPTEGLYDLQRLANMRSKQISADPHYHPWSLRVLIRKHDEALLGYCNFHAPPGDAALAKFGNRAVEMGYTILAPYRRQGYAHEAVLGCMAWAHPHGADILILSISPHNEPSLRLAAKLGAIKVGEQIDEEDGLEFVFRTDFAASRPQCSVRV